MLFKWERFMLLKLSALKLGSVGSVGVGRLLFGKFPHGFGGGEVMLAALLLGVDTFGEVTLGVVAVGVEAGAALLFCGLLLLLLFRQKLPVNPPKFILTIDGTAILVAVWLLVVAVTIGYKFRI